MGMPIPEEYGGGGTGYGVRLIAELATNLSA